jgi:hypothetical protein
VLNKLETAHIPNPITKPNKIIGHRQVRRGVRQKRKNVGHPTAALPAQLGIPHLVKPLPGQWHKVRVWHIDLHHRPAAKPGEPNLLAHNRGTHLHDG